MVHSTVLPKRNSAIIVLYSLLIIFMFVFMSAVLYFHLPQQKQSFQSELADNNKLVQQPQKIILGKQYILSLSTDYNSLLNHAWEDFYQDKEIVKLVIPKNEKEVYQIYNNYDATENKVDIVIGYLVDQKQTVNPPYHVVTLASGTYLKTNSVLDTWYQAQKDKPAVTLNYQYDYEHIQLDEQYSIHSQTAYLSVE